MNDAVLEVERLQKELLAGAELWPETVEDVERIVATARDGTLASEDLGYLRALHRRLLTGASAPEDDSDPDPDPDEEDNDVDWKVRAEAAERLLAEASSGDARFEEIKCRFLARYHPDNISAEDDEADVQARQTVYRDFWPEFEAVEDEVD